MNARCPHTPGSHARRILSVAILCGLLGATPVLAREAVTRPPAPQRATHFDWRLYESWARAHHHPGIPLTRFSWPWMAHRGLCGGAVSAEILNARTMSFIQDFDRCWGRWGPLGKAPTFMRYADAGLGSQSEGGGTAASLVGT